MDVAPGNAIESPGAARLAGVSRRGFGAAPIGDLYRTLSSDQAVSAVAAALTLAARPSPLGLWDALRADVSTPSQQAA